MKHIENYTAIRPTLCLGWNAVQILELHSVLSTTHQLQKFNNQGQNEFYNRLPTLKICIGLFDYLVSKQTSFCVSITDNYL